VVVSTAGPSGDRLFAALETANIPSLLMVVYQLTGEKKWLAAPYRPRRPKGIDDDDDGGLSTRAQAEVRSAAWQAIIRWASGTAPAVSAPRGEQLQRMMSTCVGEDVSIEYGHMTAVEMGFETRPTVSRDGQPPAADAGPRVAVIGAGVGGLTMALALKNAGFTYSVFERGADVGGVWLSNTYPGAGVDTPSFLYSWAFYPRRWTGYFAKRDEVLEYIRDMASNYELRDDIEFDSEVTDCVWDDDRDVWTLTVRHGGVARTVEADFVVSAVGVFSTPSVPPIPGLDEFGGPIFHSSQWPDGLDVEGRRFAVIGTGASAMQIVPAVHSAAAAVGVFQRSAQWVAPAAKYFQAVGEDIHLVMDSVPFYRGWYRFRLGWTFGDKRHSSMQRDASWKGHAHAINERNDRLRQFLASYIATELDGHPDLVDRATPVYPPYGKRMLLDNGWYAALKANNVELITDPVERLTADGVRTASGREWKADAVVLCTGFSAQRFLHTVNVSGRNAELLRTAWSDDDARAYLGIMTPGFPNFCYIYGPNTNSGGGSYFSLAESQANYIIRLLSRMTEQRLTSVEPSPESFLRYNQDVDAAHEKMIWTHPGLTSYYRNSRGRIVVNMPWRGVEYWNRVDEPDFDDLVSKSADRSTT